MASFLRWVGIERRGQRAGRENGLPSESAWPTVKGEAARRNLATPQAGSSPAPAIDRILTVPEVAAYLRLHPSSVYRLLKEKKIPAFRVASEWRFSLNQIDAWRLALEGQQVK